MSTHCNRYPGCGCPENIGTKCDKPQNSFQCPVIDIPETPFSCAGGENNFDIEKEKRRIDGVGEFNKMSKINRGTNLTPPKKKRKKKGRRK